MTVSKTAAYVALYRALETHERRRPPLFRDPYALRFLPRLYRLLVRAARLPLLRRALLRYADKRAPGARTSVLARTLFIDDQVRAALARGVRQVVLLGAGFDCRAHRLPELAHAQVYEVDRAPTQALKRRQVPTSSVRYVAVDFLKDDTFARLAEAGWKKHQPSLFVWEGVTNYLREDAVRRVLQALSETAPGTTLVFTYIHRGVIDGSVSFPGSERILGNVRALREPWTFGLTPAELPAFLASAGLVLREELGADAYRARYLPRDEQDDGYAFYRIAVVERPELTS